LCLAQLYFAKRGSPSTTERGQPLSHVVVCETPRSSSFEVKDHKSSWSSSNLTPWRWNTDLLASSASVPTEFVQSLPFAAWTLALQFMLQFARVITAGNS
jgi:hypothetical protein